MPTSARRSLAVLASPGVRLAGTLLGLFLILRSVDLAAAAHGLRQADGRLLALGFALTGLGLVGAVMAWGFLLQAAGHRVPWGRLGGWYLQSLFAGQLTPASIGGDTMRAASCSRIAGWSDAVASLLGSRLASATVMALWAVAGAVLLRGWLGPGAWVLGAGFTAFLCACWAILLQAQHCAGRLASSRLGLLRRVARVLAPLGAPFARYRSRPVALGRVLLVAAAGWGLNLCALAVFAAALDVPAGWTTFAVATPVSLIATLAPFSLNGIGLREGALVGMLAHAGASSSHAAVLSLVIDLQLLPFVLCGAMLWAAMGRRAAAMKPAGMTAVPQPCDLPTQR